MSDNFKIDICNIGAEELDIALGIAFRQAPGKKSSHYIKKKMESTHRFGVARQEVETLIFLWHEEKGSIPFPSDISSSEASIIAQKFINSVDAGPQPDHDGSNSIGFRVFNEAWGHVAGHRHAVVAVQPCWMMYGK